MEHDVRELSGSQGKKRKSLEENHKSHSKPRLPIEEEDKDQETEDKGLQQSNKEKPLECYQCRGPHKMRYYGFPLPKLPP